MVGTIFNANMASLGVIFVKISILGEPIIEVSLPSGSSVRNAITAGKTVYPHIDDYSDIRKNGKLASNSEIIKDGDIITMIPVRGAMNKKQPLKETVEQHMNKSETIITKVSEPTMFTDESMKRVLKCEIVDYRNSR